MDLGRYVANVPAAVAALMVDILRIVYNMSGLTTLMGALKPINRFLSEQTLHHRIICLEGLVSCPKWDLNHGTR